MNEELKQTISEAKVIREDWINLWADDDPRVKVLDKLIQVAQSFVDCKGMPFRRIITELDKGITVTMSKEEMKDEINHYIDLCATVMVVNNEFIFSEIDKVKTLIKDEIERRQGYSNLGKIGCLKNVIKMEESIRARLTSGMCFVNKSEAQT